MTVKELIEMLQQLPDDLEVMLDMTMEDDELFHFAGIAIVDIVEIPASGQEDEEEVVLLSCVNYEQFEEDKTMYN